MTKHEAKATKPEWFTDCVHCLGEVDPDQPHLISLHRDPANPDGPELVACTHIACEDMVRKQLEQGATLRVSMALLKPCPPELAAYLTAVEHGSANR